MNLPIATEITLMYNVFNLLSTVYLLSYQNCSVLLVPLTDLVNGSGTSSSCGSLLLSLSDLGLGTHCLVRSLNWRLQDKLCNSIPSSEPLLLKLDFCCFNQDFPEYAGKNSNKWPLSGDDEPSVLSCSDVFELGNESWDNLGGGNLKVIGIKVLLSTKKQRKKNIL